MSSVRRFHIVTPQNLLGDSVFSMKPVQAGFKTDRAIVSYQ